MKFPGRHSKSAQLLVHINCLVRFWIIQKQFQYNSLKTNFFLNKKFIEFSVFCLWKVIFFYLIVYLLYYFILHYNKKNICFNHYLQLISWTAVSWIWESDQSYLWLNNLWTGWTNSFKRSESKEWLIHAWISLLLIFIWQK